MKKETNKDIKGRVRLPAWKILLFLFLCLMALMFGFWLNWGYQEERKQEERKQEEQYEEIQKIKKKKGVTDLKETYPDMIGWIEIENTPFSYPVMQTKKNPEYYLHRDVHGEYSFYGTPFLDARCKRESDIRIIYGHNINGRRFFGYLQYFREEDFYKKYPEFCFIDGEEKDTYKILAVLETDIHSEIYENTDIFNDEQYRDIVSHMIRNSIYRCEVMDMVEKEMKEETVEAFFHHYQFIALSTCRSSEGKDKRLLVIGCKERQE